MQKGFATLEMILLTLTVTLLATSALPNLDNILDKATLDYETKRIYSRLRFLQSFDRMTTMTEDHFSAFKTNDTVSLLVNPENYKIQKFSLAEVHEDYFLPTGFKLAYKSSAIAPDRIEFNYMGKVSPAISNTLRITSRRGKVFSIVFDSVGRFRGNRGE